MEEEFDFKAMNEADVRETIARPFLHSLGYKQGTRYNIRTEVPLRYSRKFLGRKKSTDPELRGKPDYVCDVVGCVSWVLEVKAPALDLSQDDVEQAHSYSVHPEINAPIFVLTNGKTFRIYKTTDIKVPILEWELRNQERDLTRIKNILSPELISERAKRDQLLAETPLALGFGSSAKVAGGILTYGDYEAEFLPIQHELEKMKGIRATVRGGSLYRDDRGLIHAKLVVAGPTEEWDRLNAAAGVESFTFVTNDEFVSTDDNQPSIFQSLTKFNLPAGSSFAGASVLGLASTVFPFDLKFDTFSQATGYLSRDGKFIGTFMIIYQIELPAEILRMLPKSTSTDMISVGEFEIQIV